MAWTSSSTSIDLQSFGFWQGSSGYQAARAELTPAQLSALDALCLVPTPSGSRSADGVSYVIRISDAAGSVAEYRAAPGDDLDSDESDPTRRTIEFASFQPFLDTFQCLTASHTRFPPGVTGASASADAGGELPWSSAPLAATGGCLHGAFVPYECADVWLRLNVEVPGTYRLAAVRCLETTSLTLLSADGSSELASASGVSPSGATPDCTALTHTFAEPGNYPVRLQKTNSAGCSRSGTAGDLLFRAAPVAGAP